MQALPFKRDKAQTPLVDEIKQVEPELVKEDLTQQPSIEETQAAEPEIKSRSYDDEMPTSLSKITAPPVPLSSESEIPAGETLEAKVEAQAEGEIEQAGQLDPSPVASSQAETKPAQKFEAEQAVKKQAEDVQDETPVPTESEILRQLDEEQNLEVETEGAKVDEDIIVPPTEPEAKEKASASGAKTKDFEDVSPPAGVSIPMPGFVEKELPQESVAVTEDLPAVEPQVEATPVVQEPQYPINLKTYTSPPVDDDETDDWWDEESQTKEPTKKQREAIDLAQYTSPQGEESPTSEMETDDWWGEEVQVEQPAETQEEGHSGQG